MIKRILGCDISLSSTGWAIIDVNTETSECSVVRIGSTITKKLKGRGRKLRMIHEQMVYLRDKYSPEIVVAEQPFSKHHKSTQAIYQSTGIVQFVFSEHDIIWYAPSSLKKAVTQSGVSDKQTVADTLGGIFEGTTFQNDDESDAVGVVITHVELSDEFTTNG